MDEFYFFKLFKSCVLFFVLLFIDFMIFVGEFVIIIFFGIFLVIIELVVIIEFLLILIFLRIIELVLINVLFLIIYGFLFGGFKILVIIVLVFK